MVTLCSFVSPSVLSKSVTADSFKFGRVNFALLVFKSVTDDKAIGISLLFFCVAIWSVAIVEDVKILFNVWRFAVVSFEPMNSAVVVSFLVVCALIIIVFTKLVMVDPTSLTLASAKVDSVIAIFVLFGALCVAVMIIAGIVVFTTVVGSSMLIDFVVCNFVLVEFSIADSVYSAFTKTGTVVISSVILSFVVNVFAVATSVVDDAMTCNSLLFGWIVVCSVIISDKGDTKIAKVALFSASSFKNLLSRSVPFDDETGLTVAGAVSFKEIGNIE